MYTLATVGLTSGTLFNFKVDFLHNELFVSGVHARFIDHHVNIKALRPFKS